MRPDGNGKQVAMSVDVKTGKAVPYSGAVSADSRVIMGGPGGGGAQQEKRNQTFSPDSQWVAYTKKTTTFT
jgi:hypothetical protein